MLIISFIITLIAFAFLLFVIVAVCRILYNAVSGMFEIWTGKAKGDSCCPNTYPWEERHGNIKITINKKSSNSR